MSDLKLATEAEIYTSGYCVRCDIVHTLPQGAAGTACYRLMEQFEKYQCIDFSLPAEERDPRCRIDYLFGQARGKMFGALVGLDEQGQEHVCFAFSGQYNGLWSVTGWIEPLFRPKAFDKLIYQREKKIKEISAILAKKELELPQAALLKKQRKAISQQLMKDIHQLYSCGNFKGLRRSLPEVFTGDGAPPSGTGDCCAPKLLNYAARNRIQPTGIAEFFWGRENPSNTRQHGHFYPPCSNKCEPILGYLLCGIEHHEP